MVLTLQVKGDGAVFELMERRVVALIDVGEFSLKPVKFVFVLWLGILQLLEFRV